ncbi:MAG: hypothetical protein ACYDA2_09410, partial [Acidimicrobiales bacterium]
RARALVPVATTVAGLVVLAAFPSHAGQKLTVEAIPAKVSALSPTYLDGFIGKSVPNTVCAVLTTPPYEHEGTSVQCLVSANTSLSAYPAQIEMTVTGPNTSAVRNEVRSILYFGTQLAYYRGGPTGPIVVSKPSLVLGAPVIGAGLGMFLFFALPRRRRAGTSEEPSPGASPDVPAYRAMAGAK